MQKKGNQNKKTFFLCQVLLIREHVIVVIVLSGFNVVGSLPGNTKGLDVTVVVDWSF